MAANFIETINCPCCKRQLGKDEYRRTKRKSPTSPH